MEYTELLTHLGANEQVRDTGCILLQLRLPFLTHVLEAGRIYHREADEEDIGHRVGQRPQAVVVLLKEDGTEILIIIWRQVSRRDSFPFLNT